jgi:mgtE-like transporter
LAVSGLVAFVCLGFFVLMVAPLTGIRQFGTWSFLLATLLSGGCLTVLTIGLSLWTCLASFRRGLDPDDVVVPVVSTLTDLLGIILLLFFIAILGT